MLGKFWYIFVLAILKTNLPSHHLSKCNFILNYAFSAFLYISETTRTNFFKMKSHNLHNLCNNVWNFYYDWFTLTAWNIRGQAKAAVCKPVFFPSFFVKKCWRRDLNPTVQCWFRLACFSSTNSSSFHNSQPLETIFNGAFCNCFASCRLAKTFTLKLKCSAFIRNTSFTENWKGRPKNWVFALRGQIPVPARYWATLL